MFPIYDNIERALFFRILKTADSALRQKIRKLIDVGLLQFAI